jgi:protein MpaA
MRRSTEPTKSLEQHLFLVVPQAAARLVLPSAGAPACRPDATLRPARAAIFLRAGGGLTLSKAARARRIFCVFVSSAFIAFRRDKLHDILRVERLGKNHGGYRGETIDIRAGLRAAETAAHQHGWASEIFHETAGFKLPALHRKSEARIQKPAARIYISTGIHGDEPAGPLAALKLIRENRWPADAEIFLLPCLNPLGFTLNRRENAEGRDLNRDYRQLRATEVRAHIAWLERQPVFALYLCLHEDWESRGFYLYEQNPDAQPSLAEAIVTAVQKVCPIDTSEIIEGRSARNGVIRPNLQPLERPDWPEAFYLISHKSRLGYTLEAPSDFPLPVRVNALAAAVHAAMESLGARPPGAAGLE